MTGINELYLITDCEEWNCTFTVILKALILILNIFSVKAFLCEVITKTKSV